MRFTPVRLTFVRFTVGSASALILLAMAGTGCMKMKPTGEVLPPPPGPAAELPGPPPPQPAPPEEVRPIPFAGGLPPADPPPSPTPPPRPLAPWDKQALDVLYERPSPMGPPPVAREPAAAMYVVGKGPIVRALPGPTVFAEKVPPALAEAGGPKSMFSNNIAPLPRGEVRFASFDRTVNDSKMSMDSMAFEATFTDEEGAEWRILQARIAPLSPNPVMNPWYGGVAIDTLEHGQTMRGHPAEPLVHCAMCSWGWADVWKNGNRVASSALMHVMLTSDVRDDANGFEYACYDCTKNPVREIHVLIEPEANLPTPGGFLHVMWENSEITRGSPDEIEKMPAIPGPGLPSVLLNAVPHLEWSDAEIELRVGQPVRLVLMNMDPASFHAFMMHAPEGEVHVPLPQGTQWVTTMVFDQPGEYEYWCPVGNHRMRGMYGRIVVTGGVPGGTEGPP